MFKMNSLMVSEYFDDGSVHKKKQQLEFNVTASPTTLGILYMFYDKISFSSEKTRRGLENVWRNWSTIESNFAKTTSPVEAYVHVYYRNI